MYKQADGFLGRTDESAASRNELMKAISNQRSRIKSTRERAEADNLQPIDCFGGALSGRYKVLEFLQENLEEMRHCLEIEQRLPETLKKYPGWY